MIGKDLIFISRILRDGTGVAMMPPNYDASHLDKVNFNMNSLSITNGTFIACEFNSYVVKLKNPKT